MIPLLLLEDEARVASFVSRGLQAEGYAVTQVARGREAIEAALREAFDLIVLDIKVPDMSGLDVCAALRKAGLGTPILMLTARDSVQDVVEGLERGADDYLTKPFDFDELLARLRALRRRGDKPLSGAPPAEFALGSLRLDMDAHEARLGEDRIDVTGKEFAVLALLLASAGKVLSRQRILSAAWGADGDPLTNVVDVYVARLRRKLDHSDLRIETVRGKGYKLQLR